MKGKREGASEKDKELDMIVKFTKNCSIPEAWRGEWLLNGKERVTITAKTVSDVGVCTHQDGHGKFLLMDRDGCVRCMAFTSQHRNLLQYKKSYCKSSSDLEKVCSSIKSQAELRTLVKENGEPIPCPFQGHWDFSYTNHSKTCDNPKSEIAACADESRAQFNFRKCPGNRGNYHYQRSENFQCLAIWDNGHDHFLYGKFTASGRTSVSLAASGSPYRCLMYTVTGAQGKMAMSADATCNDIQSYAIGPVEFDLSLRRDKRPQAVCNFPWFLEPTSEWRDVSGSLKFEVNGRHDLFVVSDIPDTDGAWSERRRRVACIKDFHRNQNEAGNVLQRLAFITDDKCESAYKCIQFTRYARDVVEVKIGHISKYAGSLCLDSDFMDTISTRHMLFPYKPQPIECPLPGVHLYEDLGSGCTGKLRVGCQTEAEIEVEGRCANQQAVDVLQCYASWSTSQTIYVLAGKLNDQKKAVYCLMYQAHSKGYLLESSAECGVDALTIMGSPIKFQMNANTALCSESTSLPEDRPGSHHPRDSHEHGSHGTYHTNDQAGSSGSTSSSGGSKGDKRQPEVIKTPSGTGVNTGSGPRQTSGIINADGDRNGSRSVTSPVYNRSVFISLAFVITLLVLSSHR
ncbi:hypothetical protein ElyMa_000833700 [Elysia marginata]|uniref:Uncharacterized protein n=1 Tax=Elysia marginata TaxID=1093978 RepID=A0AAV4GYN7_9GAST|nr:hypothetical protein ElyMa_000833700 [Elysia marginata]